MKIADLSVEDFVVGGDEINRTADEEDERQECRYRYPGPNLVLTRPPKREKAFGRRGMRFRR